MWNRREWARGVASGVLGTAMTRAMAELRPLPPPAQAPVRPAFGKLQLAVDSRTSLCYLPLTVAERLGYFAAEGLDVQVKEMAEPGQALQALLSGAVQALSGPYSASVLLRARGQSFPSIVVQGRTPQLVMGVSRKSMAGYRDLRDLRGRKVAIAGIGTGSHRMVQVLLNTARLGSESVQLVPLGSQSSALASFRNGLVDAICYSDPVMTQLEQDGALRVVADTRTVRGNADVFGGPLPAGCLSVSAEYLASHGAECQAMVDAMVRALKWLQTAGPSDINRTVPESYFHGDRALYLSAFSRVREAWTPDGLMPEGGPATVARMLARLDQGTGPEQVDLAQTFTNALALKAKARFRL
jgi:NitT/TauT family transport system substrate-binding protein